MGKKDKIKKVYVALSGVDSNKPSLVAWSLNKGLFDEYVHDRQEYFKRNNISYGAVKIKDVPEGKYGVSYDGEILNTCSPDVEDYEITLHHNSPMTYEEITYMETAFGEYESEMFHDIETFLGLLQYMKYTDEEFECIKDMVKIMRHFLLAYNEGTLFDDTETYEEVYNMVNVTRIFICNVLTGL